MKRKKVLNKAREGGEEGGVVWRGKEELLEGVREGVSKERVGGAKSEGEKEIDGNK